MREIGIAEAKARLSHVLQDVQQGAEWLITDRGRPVARILPVEPASLSLNERLMMLQERGVLERRRKNPDLVIPHPLPISEKGLAQRYLQEDRESGR